MNSPFLYDRWNHSTATDAPSPTTPASGLHPSPEASTLGIPTPDLPAEGAGCAETEASRTWRVASVQRFNALPRTERNALLAELSLSQGVLLECLADDLSLADIAQLREQSLATVCEDCRTLAETLQAWWQRYRQ